MQSYSIKHSLLLQLLVLCCSGTVYSADTNIDRMRMELESYEDSVDSLVEHFAKSTKTFFSDRQAVAEELLESDRTTKEGFALKKLSNLFMRTKCVEYAIWRNAIEISKITLIRQFDSNEPEVAPEMRLDIDELDMFGARAALRASVDAFYYSKPQWDQIHRLLENYVGNGARLELLELAHDMYKERQKNSVIAYKLLDEIDEYSAEQNLTPEAALSALIRFDNLLEEGTGCSADDCARKELGEDYFGLRLMLVNAGQVEGLVRKYVSSDLLMALEQSEQSVEGQLPSFVDEAEVDMDEIDARQEKFLEEHS